MRCRYRPTKVSLRREHSSKLLLRYGEIQIAEGNIGHWGEEKCEGDHIVVAICRDLDRGHVLCLPALRALGYFELHCLALLQALEAARLNGREMHENVFAGLTADKAVTFGVIEPLNCSLFHIVVLFVPLL